MKRLMVFVMVLMIVGCGGKSDIELATEKIDSLKEEGYSSDFSVILRDLESQPISFETDEGDVDHDAYNKVSNAIVSASNKRNSKILQTFSDMKIVDGEVTDKSKKEFFFGITLSVLSELNRYDISYYHSFNKLIDDMYDIYSTKKEILRFPPKTMTSGEEIDIFEEGIKRSETSISKNELLVYILFKRFYDSLYSIDYNVKDEDVIGLFVSPEGHIKLSEITAYIGSNSDHWWVSQ